jgi:hypothetical protein
MGRAGQGWVQGCRAGEGRGGCRAVGQGQMGMPGAGRVCGGGWGGRRGALEAGRWPAKQRERGRASRAERRGQASRGNGSTAKESRAGRARARRGTLVRICRLVPTSGFLGCLGRTASSCCCGPLARCSGTMPSDSTAVWRGQTGSITRLLALQILSHSCGGRGQREGEGPIASGQGGTRRKDRQAGRPEAVPLPSGGPSSSGTRLGGGGPGLPAGTPWWPSPPLPQGLPPGARRRGPGLGPPAPRRACTVTFLEAPCSMMNSRSACSVSPRRSMPCTAQHSTAQHVSMPRERHAGKRTEPAGRPAGSGRRGNSPPRKHGAGRPGTAQRRHSQKTKQAAAEGQRQAGRRRKRQRHWKRRRLRGARLHCGHARVVPPFHQAILHKPGQLALGQHRVHKRQPARARAGEVGRRGGGGGGVGGRQPAAGLLGASGAGWLQPQLSGGVCVCVWGASPRVVPHVYVRQAGPRRLLQLEHPVELGLRGWARVWGSEPGSGAGPRRLLQPEQRSAAQRSAGSPLGPCTLTCAARASPPQTSPQRGTQSRRWGSTAPGAGRVRQGGGRQRRGVGCEQAPARPGIAPGGKRAEAWEAPCGGSAPPALSPRAPPAGKAPAAGRSSCRHGPSCGPWPPAPRGPPQAGAHLVRGPRAPVRRQVAAEGDRVAQRRVAGRHVQLQAQAVAQAWGGECVGERASEWVSE